MIDYSLYEYKRSEYRMNFSEPNYVKEFRPTTKKSVNLNGVHTLEIKDDNGQVKVLVSVDRSKNNTTTVTTFGTVSLTQSEWRYINSFVESVISYKEY